VKRNYKVYEPRYGQLSNVAGVSIVGVYGLELLGRGSPSDVEPRDRGWSRTESTFLRMRRTKVFARTMRLSEILARALGMSERYIVGGDNLPSDFFDISVSCGGDSARSAALLMHAVEQTFSVRVHSTFKDTDVYVLARGQNWADAGYAKAKEKTFSHYLGVRRHSDGKYYSLYEFHGGDFDRIAAWIEERTLDKRVKNETNLAGTFDGQFEYCWENSKLASLIESLRGHGLVLTEAVRPERHLVIEPAK
jgi:uncharacterized protein (TIGR03435 family)